MAGARFSYSRGDLRRSGPKIRVTITHPATTLALAKQSQKELKQPWTITALIDTGASRTVINPEVATTCGLRQTGEARISAAGQISLRPEFAGAICFPDANLQNFDPLYLVACPLPEQDVSCLLGRDVLERWNLHSDGRTGEVDVEE
jgi:predicted aspartyl protease